MKVINKNLKTGTEYIYTTLLYGKFRILEEIKEEGKSNFKYLIEFENTKHQKSDRGYFVISRNEYS